MKEIFSAISQNGRRGLAIVSEVFENVSAPVQCSISHLGKISGKTVYRIEPTDAKQWLLVGDDLQALSGCTLITTMDLQGNGDVSLVLMGPEAIVRSWGYKRRSSNVYYYKCGKREPVPSAILLALGLVASDTEPEKVETPPPFLADDGSRAATAQALATAGY